MQDVSLFKNTFRKHILSFACVIMFMLTVSSAVDRNVIKFSEQNKLDKIFEKGDRNFYPNVDRTILKSKNPYINFPTSLFFDGNWMVIAGSRVTPGCLYRVVVEASSKELGSLTVKSTLSHNGQQVSHASLPLQSGELSHLLLQVPDTSVSGEWILKVRGFEGGSQRALFEAETRLTFSPRFLTILIQTSQAVYNGGQTVRFRGVLLNRLYKPYEGPVDVYVRDPRGMVMRRWPSRQTGDGVVSLNFELPEFPSLGNWSIEIKVRNQVKKKTILVERYFQTRFEVFVRLPQAIISSQEFIEGHVIANMTNWRDVYGNCSLELQVATNQDFPVPTQFQTVHKEFIYNFTGKYSFALPMKSVRQAVEIQQENIARVFVSVGDAFGGKIHSGFAFSKIVEEKMKIGFLGDEPLYFKPGMPLTVHVFLSYEDEHPVEDSVLRDSEVRVTFTSSAVHSVLLNGTDLLEGKGVVSATANTPEDAASLDITARFTHKDGQSHAARLVGLQHHSAKGRFIQIETSTDDSTPGNYLVLHVRLNCYAPKINYVVVSNGVIIANGFELVEEVSFPTVITFTLPVSSEMAPVAKILAWVIDIDSSILSHSVFVPVNVLGQHKVDMHWNQHKDHSGETVEVKMVGEPGAYFGTSAVWEEAHLMNSDHDFDGSSVLEEILTSDEKEFLTSEDIRPNVRRVFFRHREGHGSDLRVFNTPSPGPDAFRTFMFADTVLLTNVKVPTHSGSIGDNCEHLQTCFTGGCFEDHRRCDGVRDCQDGTDELGCPPPLDPLRHFRLHRTNRISRFYGSHNGDWAWKEIRGYGNEIATFSIPKVPQTWVVSGFAVGGNSGFGVIKEKLRFDGTRPFIMKIDAPPLARMWEQVSLTIGIFNHHKVTISVFLTLSHSKDYEMIMVEENGIVDSYNPKKTKGTFQHIIWLESGTSSDVQIPIVFTKLGEVEITVRGSTQTSKDSETVVIEVVPEGVSIGQHTSVLFDLKNRALAYEFLDLHLDESPIIPYSLQRRYVYSTAEGHISVTGDIVGPIFPEIPVNEDLLLGFGVMGAETSAFSFASNIWNLHYLRLTNQISADVTYQVLNGANLYYAELARYQNEQGGFSNWIGSESSVWLTSHALRSLWSSSFEDWENLIYVDPLIYSQGISFILEHQTGLGSFAETNFYALPLDQRFRSKTLMTDRTNHNVSLTASILITLSDISPALEGELHREANVAKRSAMKYLENVLHLLTDPYELAIVSWALFKADSAERNLAFSLLDSMKRVDGDRIYWCKDKIVFNELVYEDSQRPYLQPKGDNEWDAYAVEATSYALLVYIKYGGIGNIQENIVRFLASMRKSDGGLISSVDTLVALEALVEYSYRARIRDITDMDIYIQPSADYNSTINFHMSNKGLYEMQEVGLDHIFGHLTITGRGAGQAILQLDYSYGVDNVDEIDYPVVPSFEFDVTARYHGRNNSRITITSCQRWINLAESNESGLTIVDVHLPSGYYIVQSDLMGMVNERQVNHLRWALVKSSNVLFFFNRVESEKMCFSYEIDRWYPVSNHSRFNLAVIYELYQPERFEMKLFEVYPLYVLDICEVCGSFQCPYCPFYSTSSERKPDVLLMVFLTLFLALLTDVLLCKQNTK